MAFIQSHLPGPWSIIHRSIGPAFSPQIAHVIGLISKSSSFIFITCGGPATYCSKSRVSEFEFFGCTLSPALQLLRDAYPILYARLLKSWLLGLRPISNTPSRRR